MELKELIAIHPGCYKFNHGDHFGDNNSSCEHDFEWIGTMTYKCKKCGIWKHDYGGVIFPDVYFYPQK